MNPKRPTNPAPIPGKPVPISREALRSAILDVINFHREQFLVASTGDRIAVALRNTLENRSTTNYCASLTATISRPAYFPAPLTGPAAGTFRYWVIAGTANLVLPDDFDQPIDLSISAGTVGLYLKILLSETAHRLVVASAEFHTTDPETPPENADWGLDGELPGFVYFPLALIDPAKGAAGIENYGAGSLIVSAPLTAINPQSGGLTSYTREVAIYRQTT